jgi:predicted Zn-dependent peptidase
LREKRGLTYHSNATITFYEIGGVFVIQAITNPDRLMRDGKSDGVLPVLFDMLTHLIDVGVSDAEVKWAKQRMRESFELEQLIGEERCGYNGIRVLLHNEMDIITVDKMYNKYYKPIDKKRINSIIKKYFSLDSVYLFLYGKKLPTTSAIESMIEKRG